MSYNPNNANGQATSANSAPVVVASDQSAIPVSATSLPLPTGAATAANQSTEISSLATIASNTTNSGTPVVSGSVTANAGTNLNTSALALETGGNLATIASKTPSLGTASMATSSPVNLSNALTVVTSTYNSTTGTANMDMLSGTTNGWYDVSAFNQMALTIYTTTTVTGGVITFETTDDITNDASGITLNIQDESVVTQTNVTTLTLAASTVKRYRAPIQKRYIRLRLSTAFAGTGAVGATLTLKQIPYAPIVMGVVQATSGSLNVNVGTGTIATVTNSNTGFPAQIADVTSAAITTTTTSGPFTPTYGNSYQVTVDVTAVSGTTPTMDLVIFESRDAGTNYIPIYAFPRITTTGSYASPLLPLTGNRVEYIQTIAGTTPSFTRSISRAQSSSGVSSFIRQIFDRAVTLTSLSSFTASLIAEQQTKNITMTVNIGAATVAPALQIQASDDVGATWYNVGTPLTAVASSTVSLTVNNITAQQYRAIVTTAGTGVTAGYVMLRAF